MEQCLRHKISGQEHVPDTYYDRCSSYYQYLARGNDRHPRHKRDAG
jgi:hypothetical protein